MLDSGKNYFELFDLPMSLAIDAKLLTDRYRLLVTVAQADRLAAGQDADLPATATMAEVDEAYRTLIDPLSRAEYVLSLHPADREEAAEQAGKEGAFLMEQMELRATLAEAIQRPDPATAVARVLTRLTEQSAALDKALQGLCAEPSSRNLGAAREILRQRQFLGRCRRDAESRQAALDREIRIQPQPRPFRASNLSETNPFT